MLQENPNALRAASQLVYGLHKQRVRQPEAWARVSH